MHSDTPKFGTRFGTDRVTGWIFSTNPKYFLDIKPKSHPASEIRNPDHQLEHVLLQIVLHFQKKRGKGFNPSLKKSRYNQHNMMMLLRPASSGSLAVAIVLLACNFIGRSNAYVTVVVELDPYFSSPPPACSATFINNFESNLTTWVVNATRTIAFLSDFSVPGGFSLAYQNPTSRRNLLMEEEKNAIRSRSLKTAPVCTKCTSVGCSLSCGLGVCNLCASSRRHLDQDATDRSFQFQHHEATASQLRREDERGADGQRRVTQADWSTVGNYVSNAIEPMIIYYASVYSGGCLGDYNLLGVNVTFVSDIPLDATMEAALVAAFGAPAPAPPPNTAKACCTMDFTSCVTYCGTTQQQCESCGAADVVWLPKGPPAAGSCIARWGGCLSNVHGCCPGMQCIGNQYWKGCFYIPPQHGNSPSPPTASSPIISSPPPTPPPTLRPTSRPTTGSWWWHA